MLRLSIICLFGLLPALLAAAELDGHYLARLDGQRQPEVVTTCTGRSGSGHRFRLEAVHGRPR